MTTNELSQYRHLRREIRELRRRIAELEEQAERHCGRLTGLPRRKGTNDITGRLALQLAGCREELERMLLKCTKELIRLNAYIGECPDSFVRVILTLRYIDGLPWNQVAASIGNTSEYAVKHIAYRYIQRN